MGGILSRAEGSPKASQNACRQSVLGSIDLVSNCVDYLVVDELYGSARPVCTAWRAAADLTPGRLSLERRPGESRAAFNWIDGMSFQLIGGVPDEPDAPSSTVIYNQAGLPYSTFIIRDYGLRRLWYPREKITAFQYFCFAAMRAPRRSWWSTDWLTDEAIAWDIVRWVESRSVAELVGYDGRIFQRWHALGAAGQQPYRDLAARDAELHERRFKRWCAASLRPDELNRLVAYDRPEIVLIAGDDGSAQIFEAPNGRHFTVRDLLDAMVKHEKRLMRFPTGHAHFVGLRQHERWPAMYYVVWEWHPDEGEPFLIE